MVALAVALAFLLGGALTIDGPPRVAADPGPNSLRLGATYDVAATLNWAKSRLIVTSTAAVTNRSGEAVSQLSFNLLPARIGQMVLGDVVVDGRPATATVDDQTLVVNLPSPLAVDAQTSVAISYRATFKSKGSGRNWMFAKLEGYATAYRWIPWLSRPMPMNSPNFGEPFVTRSTPEIRVSITSDRPLVIASTGRRTSSKGLTQTFVANDVRDFNFVASPHYRTRTESFRGIEITYYYRHLSPDKLANWTRNAVARFEQNVGEYPYAQLAVAENHDTSAMESPQMIWMPWSTPKWNFPYLMVHELAHQWFYSVIGNSQPLQPFADEALADFITRDYLGHRKSKCAQDTLDKSIYEYQGKCYYEVIYIQGERYINAYRQAVGNDNFWQAFRAFYNNHQFEMVTTRQFWDFMDARTGYKGGHAERFPTIYSEP